MRIGIAGAGLVGRLLGYELTRRGHKVTLIDPAPALAQPAPPGDPARAAGWTAAGMLSPTAELEAADLFELGLASLERWEQIVAALAAAGQAVYFARRGSLLLAHRGDEGAAARIVGLLDARAPARHAPRPLTAADLRQLEPDVQGPAHGWLLPHEGQIETPAAMRALAVAAITQGMVHLAAVADQVGDGVIRTGGDTHPFDWVFDARGGGAREQLPVRGVRGEIFWLGAPGVRLTRPVRLLHPRSRVYLVPRPGDVIVVGATEIESEDRSPVSVRSTVELLTAAHSVLPALAEARVIHSECNLRPALPDNLPRVVTETRCTRINGLFRHGWLIAPALVDAALRDAGLEGF